MKLLPGLVFAATSVWLVERVRILEQVVSSSVAKLVCVCEQQGEICEKLGKCLKESRIILLNPQCSSPLPSQPWKS